MHEVGNGEAMCVTVYRFIQPMPELQCPALYRPGTGRTAHFQAGNGGKASFHILQDVADVDLVRLTAQPVAAAFAAQSG